VERRFINGGLKMVIKVLIMDGLQKNTLAAIRTLGRKNYYIGVISNYQKLLTLGFYSKYCKEKYVINANAEDTDKYANEVSNLIKNTDFGVLLPVSLKSYLAVSKYKEKFEKIINVVVPDWEKMQIAYNKDRTMEFAANIGIPVPKTQLLQDKNNLNEIEKYPVVIKSSDAAGGFVKYCNNRKELEENFGKLNSKSKTNIIAQEYIRGFGCGFYGVYDRGKLITHSLHKRLKEFPITGGPSAVAESHFDEKLFSYGKRLCDALAWHGPIMAEFKYDVEGDDYKLIEINPKLWGSLDLTIAAGVNVPEILVNLALGKEIENVNKYSYVKYKWMFPDEFRVLISDCSLKNLKNFFRIDKNTKTNFCLNDPLPTIIQIARSFIECPAIMFSRTKKYPHGKVKRI
jgi:predicted ATP-grasp superfamily ATP-dependent carboligase